MERSIRQDFWGTKSIYYVASRQINKTRDSNGRSSYFVASLGLINFPSMPKGAHVENKCAHCYNLR